jgi:predicted HTH transcriptional regulator
MSDGSRTRLPDEKLAQVRSVVLRYLEKHEFITNRLLRGVSDIGYDQAIYVFAELMRSGDIVRIGTSSATRYVLAGTRHSSQP